MFWLFFTLMGTESVCSNGQNTTETSLIFLTVGYVLQKSHCVLYFSRFFCSWIDVRHTVFQYSRLYDYAGRKTQKARPYGRCLLTTLMKRRLGPQGHSLTQATVHHQQTAIGSLRTVWWNCMFFLAPAPLYRETSVMFIEIQPQLFHADDKVYPPTQHVLGLQLK